MKLAKVRHRIMATLLDLGIIIGFFILIALTKLPFIISMFKSKEHLVTTKLIVDVFRWGIILGVLLLVYYIVVPLLLNGQTVGKKVFKLQIVKEDGSELDYKTMFYREGIGRILINFASLGITAFASIVIMALREVVKVGDDVLRKTSKPVKIFDERLEDLIDDMWETMYANNGMGLAAPQVGVLKRVVVMDVNNMFLELINPEIIKVEGEDFEHESCLSCGKIREIVKRPYKVSVKAQDRFGYEFIVTGEKWLARCICHELDHLDGVLFFDKAEKKDK